MSDTHPRVLIFRSERTVASGMDRELMRLAHSPVVREVRTTPELRDALAEFEPDVVLFCHPANGVEPREALAVLQRERPLAAFIIVARELDEEEAVASLRAGADDLVLTSNLSRMDAALRSALDRRRLLRTLTPRQVEVLKLVAEGYTTRQIADELGLSVKTVETHRGGIMRRLGIHDLVGLVHYAIRVRLVAAHE